MAVQLHHHIGGREVPGTGPHGDVFDPATGQVAAQVPLGGAAEVAVLGERDGVAEMTCFHRDHDIRGVSGKPS